MAGWLIAVMHAHTERVFAAMFIIGVKFNVLEEPTNAEAVLNKLNIQGVIIYTMANNNVVCITLLIKIH